MIIFFSSIQGTIIFFFTDFEGSIFFHHFQEPRVSKFVCHWRTGAIRRWHTAIAAGGVGLLLIDGSSGCHPGQSEWYINIRWFIKEVINFLGLGLG